MITPADHRNMKVGDLLYPCTDSDRVWVVVEVDPFLIGIERVPRKGEERTVGLIPLSDFRGWAPTKARAVMERISK